MEGLNYKTNYSRNSFGKIMFYISFYRECKLIVARKPGLEILFSFL